jgi:hypothetical protein
MYQTDERLKSYLDTNQLHREQMCLAVIAIDKRFSDVRPRHPRGGPDSARDIEAIFKGVQRVFGAVGFINQSSDSIEHKKQAIKKFNDDLTEALKQQPQPEVFVFFTNVNLTVGEKDKLVKVATASGIAHAEVFDRERIRISLDAPDGLSIRYQYLGIALSEAEQATFFSRWGDDIQGVITNGFGQVQRLLNRILFLQEARLPLLHLTAIFELDREYSGNEIGHFRAFAWVHLRAPSQGILGLMFGATDNDDRLHEGPRVQFATGKSGISQSICGGQWHIKQMSDGGAESKSRGRANEKSRDFNYERTGTFTSVARSTVKSIPIRYDNDGFMLLLPGPELLEIDGCMFVLHLNRTLAEKLKAIKLYANEYKLMEISAEGFRFEDSSVDPTVPLSFSDEELADRWVILRPQGASCFLVHFSEQTPKRFFHADEVADS